MIWLRETSLECDCHVTVMCLSFFFSSSDFVYDLFDHMQLSDQSQGGGAGGLGRRMSMKRKGGRKKATVSSQFKDSLHSLMTMLGHANPYFVRCIKPNMTKVRLLGSRVQINSGVTCFPLPLDGRQVHT